METTSKRNNQDPEFRQSPFLDDELKFIIVKLVKDWFYKTPDVDSVFQEVKDRFRQKLDPQDASDKMLCLKLINKICGDVEDKLLLEQKSEKLVEKYQAYVKHLVYNTLLKYFPENKQSANQEMFGWLLENVNAKLVEKIILGKLNFKGEALFSVYFYRIIKNALIDEIRKLPKEKIIEPGAYNNSAIDDIPSTGSLPDYTNFLHLISTEFQSKEEQNKFIFCIKIFYRTQITLSELRSLFPNRPNKLYIAVLDTFGSNYSLMSKGDLWAVLNGFICELSYKQQTIRTTKDWMKKHRNNLLRYLLKSYPIYIPELSTGKLDRALDEYFEYIIHKQFA